MRWHQDWERITPVSPLTAPIVHNIFVFPADTATSDILPERHAKRGRQKSGPRRLQPSRAGCERGTLDGALPYARSRYNAAVKRATGPFGVPSTKEPCDANERYSVSIDAPPQPRRLRFYRRSRAHSWREPTDFVQLALEGPRPPRPQNRRSPVQISPRGLSEICCG